MARVISWVLQCIENLVLQQDIVRCQNILDNFEQYGGISVDSNFSGGVAYTGFMAVGIILYMAVPSIASWIINTSGGGIMTVMNAMGTMMMQQGLTGGSKALGAGEMLYPEWEEWRDEWQVKQPQVKQLLQEQKK